VTVLYGVGNRRTGDVESWWWTREEAESDAAELVAVDPDLAGAFSVFAADLPGGDLSALRGDGRGNTWWLTRRFTWTEITGEERTAAA
jgi:hypothetical protein